LVSEESTREDAAAGISLPRVLCIFHQPGFNHLMIKSPLVTDLKPRKLFSAQQPIDCEFVHVEIFGDFVNSEQSFRGRLIFFLVLSCADWILCGMQIKRSTAPAIEQNWLDLEAIRALNARQWIAGQFFHKHHSRTHNDLAFGSRPDRRGHTLALV